MTGAGGAILLMCRQLWGRTGFDGDVEARVACRVRHQAR
jgi:hypothetical protein